LWAPRETLSVLPTLPTQLLFPAIGTEGILERKEGGRKRGRKRGREE